MPGVGYLLNEKRTRDLATRLSAAPGLGVTRAVVFLTQRCNMACRYCLSIGHEMPGWGHTTLLDLLAELGKSGTRHVQWTGGEASLHPHLAEYVIRCTESGMSSSMSTNGMASGDCYRKLVRAGMSRFYLSIDATNPRSFDHATRTRGQLPRVLETLRTLRLLRDAGVRPGADPVHLTLNAVLQRRGVAELTSRGGQELRRFLTWLRSSGADDFKFLPASTQSSSGLFASESERRLFLGVCAREVPARFAMFHQRLASLATGGHGLRADSPKCCYQAVDDRAFDSVGAYACVIQLREGGPRIYRHVDAPKTQIEKLSVFLRQDRTRDPVCRRHCFDLYRGFNERVAHLLQARRREQV